VRIEYIAGRDNIGALRPNWESVFDSDPEATFFQSFDWLFGSDGGPGCFGFVLAARAPDDDSDFVAFLPLQPNTRYGSAGFYNLLTLVGTNATDYNGFICRPEYEEDAIPALAAELRRMNWAHLRLLNFAASERRADLFLRDFPDTDFETKPYEEFSLDGIDNNICPYAVLADDWDEFLQERLSSNMRQKIRRFLRQVEGSDAYRITHSDSETFERDLDLLMKLWTDMWGERKGKQLRTIQNSYRRLLRHAHETQTLFMPMLWHEDRPVCVLAILVDHRAKIYHFYLSGRDGSFEGPPSGLVMHAYAIRHAISNGFRKYDFLRGNEQYKYSFATEERYIRSLVLSTKSNENLGGRLDPRCLRSVQRRSTEFYRTGELADAQRGFSQILHVAPNHEGTAYWHGIASARLGDHDIAVRQFGMLARRNPDSVKIWYRLGRSLVAKRDWTAAAHAFSGLLRRNRNLPKIFYLLGQLLLMIDRSDKAVAAFREALRQRPDYADARTALEGALTSRGKPDADQFVRDVLGRAGTNIENAGVMERRLAKTTDAPSLASFGRD